VLLIGQPVRRDHRLARHAGLRLPAHALLYRTKSHRIGGYLLADVLAGFAGSVLLSGVLALLGEINTSAPAT
jgi:hypothetical protein